MTMKRTPQKIIYRNLARMRWQKILPWLDMRYKTLLDVGSVDFNSHAKLKDHFTITTCDIKGGKGVIEADVQNLPFKDNSFDIVTCFEVLEHVPDPVAAMKELRRVCKHRLLISVPNDPWFTYTRAGIWEKEHLWSIRPDAIKHQLGKPHHEQKIVFRRYYFAVFDKK